MKGFERKREEKIDKERKIKRRKKNEIQQKKEKKDTEGKDVKRKKDRKTYTNKDRKMERSIMAGCPKEDGITFFGTQQVPKIQRQTAEFLEKLVRFGVFRN